MSFSSRPRLIEPTVARVVYALGIRKALGDLSAIAEMRRPIAVLYLPKDADGKAYLASAALMKLAAPRDEQLRCLSPQRHRRGELVFNEILSVVDEGRGVVVLVEHSQIVPDQLRAAADVIASIPPVDVQDLRTATWEVTGLRLTKRQAETLLKLPLVPMLAAVRPGRTYAEILHAAEGIGAAQAAPAPRLEDLGGYGDARRWGLGLADDIAAWRRREISWYEVDAGMLLSGPPGTGKTLYAAALARSCDLSFVATSAAQWQAAGHLGDLLAAMRKSFHTASEQAPSLLFIDEFDSVGHRARFSSDHAHYSTQVVNGLLEAIDGSSRREGVVVVGATNNPNAIDPAFLRAGRLGRHFQIALPNLEDRVWIADTYLRGALSGDELQKFGAATEGMSGADIEGVVMEGRRRSRRKGVLLDFRLLLSILPPALPLVGPERRAASVHEAGHAVVGLALDFGELQSVGIVAELRPAQTIAGGALFQKRAKIMRSRQSYLDEICMRLGGLAAESVIIGCVTDGAGQGMASDLAVVSDIATAMVSQFGMGPGLRHLHTPGAEDRQRLRSTHRDVEREVADLLSEQLKRAEAIITDRRHTVDAVAKLIETNGTLAGAVVAEMMSEEDAR